MTTDETRMRRKAARYGLRLIKSRRRDPDALDYGLYALIDPTTRGAVNPPLIGQFACSWSLDEVENYLSDGEDEAEAVMTATVIDAAKLRAIDIELRRRRAASKTDNPV